MLSGIFEVLQKLALWRVLFLWTHGLAQRAREEQKVSGFALRS